MLKFSWTNLLLNGTINIDWTKAESEYSVTYANSLNADAFTTQDSKSFWQGKVKEWSTWADPLSKPASGLNKPILDYLDIKKGDMVLDLASGLGEPALSESHLAGKEGLTVATDIVPEMLTNLKTRQNTDRLSFSAADMQKLPFKSDCFDKISCRFGLMFVPDLQAALTEVSRVLKPNGKAAFIFWGPKEDQRLFRVLEDSVKSVLELDVGSAIENKYRLQAEDALNPFLSITDFEVITNKMITYTPMAPLNQNFWKAQLEMSFGHSLGNASPDDLKKLDTEILHRLKPYKQKEGYQLKLTVRLLTLVKTI